MFDDLLSGSLPLGTLLALIEQVLARPLHGVFNIDSRNRLSKADATVTLAPQLNLPGANMCRRSVNRRPLAAAQKTCGIDVAKFEATMGMPMPVLPTKIYSVCKEYENAAP
ncbi:hypothetical protein [Janthinobacterium sp. 1_2014MBL_MicDiv]|uniref:hypothetical protein n=1 Tax=Janthinobacterium sp. 1_2014MBL_MicDiv TaxID=1644131 RepID=UPI0012EBB48E|nr:hypothetical protein [Janthinobacterium sp. 1_2014MBL_MicDiv]